MNGEEQAMAEDEVSCEPLSGVVIPVLGPK